MSILILAPHPDDEVLGCGGSILRHVQRGEEVHVAVMARGRPETIPPEITERNWRNLRAAHERLGVAQTHALDFPVLSLDTTPGYQIADAVRAVIREVGAHTLYLPHHGDIHGDHRATHLAGLVAARPVGDQTVRRVLAYETLSETEWSPPRPDQAFVPTVFVDIHEQLEEKVAVFSLFETQRRAPPHPRSPEAIRALALVRGAAAGLRAAEAFMLVREVAP